MFLHISTDQIICLANWQTHILPYLNIERTFGPWLLQLLKKYNTTDIWVLNWPGSFTTLRVCCVTINLIKKQLPLRLFTSTKTDLYSRLYTTGSFPQELWVIIGQKKNLRLYDCKTRQERKIPITQRQESDLLVDHLVDTTIIWWDTYTARILHFSQQEEHLLLRTSTESWEISLTAPCRHQVDLLSPAYLMNPTMG